MKNTRTEQSSELKLAPILDNAIETIAKRCEPVDPFCPELKYVKLDEALVASRLSQLFDFCRLTEKHRDTLRILSTAKVIKADEELSRCINELPELSAFDLSSGDPGLYYLKQKMMDGHQASKLHQGTTIIQLDSDQEWENLFRTVTEYSFYKNRKKRFSGEFSLSEAQMKLTVEKYKIEGRFSWNAFVDKTNRPERAKVNTAFLIKYRSQAS